MFLCFWGKCRHLGELYLLEAFVQLQRGPKNHGGIPGGHTAVSHQKTGKSFLVTAEKISAPNDIQKKYLFAPNPQNVLRGSEGRLGLLSLTECGRILEVSYEGTVLFPNGGGTKNINRLERELRAYGRANPPNE